MTANALLERLQAPGPKRLLALTGGGLRGLISMGYVREVERGLRERHGRSDMVIADYFDLIGGTSTGAIIAGLLALGRSADEIHDLYTQIGRDAFQQRRTVLGPIGRLLGPKFDEKPLMALLHQQFGDRTLGSADLRSGLVVVTKRADTSSVWPLVNIPTQKYYERNRDIPLREAIAWSAAAPTYFRPRRHANVGDGKDAVFVDGGVSMHNSPALLLLMVATMEGFGLRWPLGEDRLLLCSLGTGGWEPTHDAAALEKANNVSLLAHLTVQIMHDAAELSRTLLQWISRSPTAGRIDRQIGTLESDVLGPRALLTYVRYDVALEADALAALDLHYDEKKIVRLRKMSDVRNIQDLDHVGQVAAARQVSADHFPPVFDVAHHRVASGGT